MIPKDRAIVIPIHIPGVKNPSGPGRDSKSGRAALTSFHKFKGPPKSR